MNTATLITPPVASPADSDQNASAALSQALAALQLSATPLEEALDNETSFWVTDENLDSTAFKVVTADQTGKTPAALLRLFQTDMKQAWSTQFRHPVFEVNEGSAVFERLPLYFHGMSLSEDMFRGDGVVRNDYSTDYFLLLANEKGRFTSLMKFNISLEPLEELFGKDCVLDEDERRTVRVNVMLEAFYTRCRFRGRGAARAMAEVVATLVDHEVQSLGTQLASFHEQTGIQARVVPNLVSTWKSKTGLLMHEKVCEVIDEFADAHSDLFADEPSRRAVVFLECEDHESDFA